MPHDEIGVGMNPSTRIQAWRLLARCRGACSNSTGACRALESAVSEAKAAGYVWMEAAALQDMARWVEGDGSTGLRQDQGADLQKLHARIDALSAGFLL